MTRFVKNQKNGHITPSELTKGRTSPTLSLSHKSLSLNFRKVENDKN